MTTANLIRLAYLIFPGGQPNTPVSPSVFQIAIAGGPSWVNSDRFWITAKAAEPVNVEMLKGPMLQTLLEERFKLALHREPKTSDVYELALAKDAAGLSPAREGRCVSLYRNRPATDAPAQPVCGSILPNPSGGIDVLRVTMADLCRQLSAYVDRPILDKTGVAGSFDVHLDLSLADLMSSSGTPETDAAGVIASAVKRLGLRMRSAKSAGEFLVIDHVERPSEN